MADPDDTDAPETTSTSEPTSTPEPTGGRPQRIAGAVGRGVRRFGPLVLVSATGAVLAIALFGNAAARIGPFDTTMSARPSTGGGTEVQLSPLGRIDLDSHTGPLGLRVRLDQLREADARAIAEDPEDFRLDEEALAADVRDGVVDLARRVVLAAAAGGGVTGLLLRRRWRSGVGGALVGLLVAGSSMGVAARTWEPDALAEPRYSGLLSLAPQAVGDAQDVVDRFSDYQAQLAGIIENVAVLYEGANDIRSYQPDDSTIRVLHVSDLHLNPQAFDLIDQVVPQFGIDVVVDTGDINDWGTTFEARFVDRIGDLDVPYVFVRGNHDSAETARAVARQPNAVVLDGDAETVAGLTFWGKGDPRFTPDKSRAGSGDDEEQVADDEAPKVARAVARDGADDIDVVVIHDPAVAADLGDVVPLVLGGHRHRANRLTLGETTTMLVEGSTGGGGLRSLQGDEPTPLSASVLYFDADSRLLQALDRIVLGGVNQADVRIERTIIPAPDDETDETDDGPDDGPVDEPEGTSTTSTTSTTSPD